MLQQLQRSPNKRPRLQGAGCGDRRCNGDKESTPIGETQPAPNSSVPDGAVYYRTARRLWPLAWHRYKSATRATAPARQ